MNFLFKGEVIDYQFFNANKNRTILFLHGWGGDKNSFAKTINLVKANFNVLTITMPTIMETNFVWDLFDYANLVDSIACANNVKNVILICHSFGFRVACLLHGKICIEKIVVTGGAGLIKDNILKRIQKNNNVIWLKKDCSLYDKLASPDYKILSPTNKNTFKNIVNINTKNLCKFNCPMLLFWGKFDQATPLWIAKKIAKINNSNCRLVISDGEHFAYLKDGDYFSNEVLKFISF